VTEMPFHPALAGERDPSHLCGDIVHAVAFIPDSLNIWFYCDKRHKVGKAFGC
jgi:hypothetical protein